MSVSACPKPARAQPCPLLWRHASSQRADPNAAQHARLRAMQTGRPGLAAPCPWVGSRARTHAEQPALHAARALDAPSSSTHSLPCPNPNHSKAACGPRARARHPLAPGRRRLHRLPARRGRRAAGRAGRAAARLPGALGRAGRACALRCGVHRVPAAVVPRPRGRHRERELRPAVTRPGGAAPGTSRPSRAGRCGGRAVGARPAIGGRGARGQARRPPLVVRAAAALARRRPCARRRIRRQGPQTEHTPAPQRAHCERGTAVRLMARRAHRARRVSPGRRATHATHALHSKARS